VYGSDRYVVGGGVAVWSIVGSGSLARVCGRGGVAWAPRPPAWEVILL